MVVALCATVAGDEQARGELAGVLGADPVSAAAFAAGLLVGPHPLVAAGAGVWVRPAGETARIKRWLAGLPAVVDTGDIPTQEEIDRWAAERTEQQVGTTAPGGREEQVVSVLPAWSAWFDGRPATLCRRHPGTSWAAAIHRAAVMLEAVLGAWILRPLQCRDRAGTSLVHLRLLDVGFAAGAAPADDPMVPVRLGHSAGESGRLAIVTSGSLGISAAAGSQ